MKFPIDKWNRFTRVAAHAAPALLAPKTAELAGKDCPTYPIQLGTKQSLRRKIHQLVEELKTADLAPHRQQEIVEQMQRLLDQIL